jgi:hypothetical protein
MSRTYRTENRDILWGEYMHEPTLTFRDPHDAFEDAIRQGRLSGDPDSPLYAGEFMYMGTYNGVDAFQHVVSRRYLPVREVQS